MKSIVTDYLRTLFLHPPAVAGFDGGAGSRYQAKREIRSFWYPTWLAQPAALVPGSRLVDAPPDGLTVDDVRPLARSYDLCVMHTSTPSFASDVRVAEALKAENPALVIGLVGAAVAVAPQASLLASAALSFVARNEFDFTIQEVAQGRRFADVLGLSYRVNGHVEHTPERPTLENMDALPFVTPVYKRDLTVEHYAIGYLQHPYVSLYTGRGCRSKCTFCLWPQTVGGQRYRTRSAEHVAEEMAQAARMFPQVREFFFDDDTFTDDLPRAEAIAKRLGPLGITWSVNAKANVPYATLKVLKDNGLRLLLVGYESGNQADPQQREEGRAPRRGAAVHARRQGRSASPSTAPSSWACPARRARPSRRPSASPPRSIPTRSRSPSPRPTRAPRSTRKRSATAGSSPTSWWTGPGVQVSAIGYPHLSRTEIFRSVDQFYRRFYFRPRKMFSLGAEMLRDRQVMKRRLSEGRDFLKFLRSHR